MPTDWDQLFTASETYQQRAKRLRAVYRARFPKTDKQRRLDAAEERQRLHDRRLFYNAMWKELEGAPEPEMTEQVQVVFQEEKPRRIVVHLPKPVQTIDLDKLGEA